MGVTGVGYGNSQVYGGYHPTKTQSSRQSQPQNAAGQTFNINLNWSDGAVFASGTPDGQNFSIYKAENYSEENPLLLIKGVDQEGNSYEQQVNPLTVDPSNASYVELMAVNAYLVDQGKLDANDLCAFERPTDNNLEKADYMKALREWRDIQFNVGNMVGYQKAANVCNALVNLRHEQNGSAKYIDGPDGKIQMTAVEGRLHSGIIGLSSFGTGDNFRFLSASYAEDSTAENPIIEVSISGEKGESSFFRINVNDIDPQNATQLEMFALCAHADAQGISAADKSGDSYMTLAEYAGYGGYEADNMADFVEKKQNWSQIIKEVGESKPDDTQNIGEKWTDLLENLIQIFMEKLSEDISGDGSVLSMISGDARYEIDNEQYSITQGEDQTFTITDKKTGISHTFSEKEAMLQKSPESGKTYLMNLDENGRVTEVMEVSRELTGFLNTFFMTNHIKPGEMQGETEEQINQLLAKVDQEDKQAL